MSWKIATNTIPQNSNKNRFTEITNVSRKQQQQQLPLFQVQKVNIKGYRVSDHYKC